MLFIVKFRKIFQLPLPNIFFKMSEIKPYTQSEDSKKVQVAQMFDKISDNYDQMNRIITFGIDKVWRNKVIKLATENQPQTLLDVATGTGDLALMAAQQSQAKIIGVDLSEGMLAVGRKKIEQLQLSSRISLQVADSEHLPFQDDEFDRVTVAFGVRNFENLDKGLQEINRVLKSGGQLIILETSVPTLPIIKEMYLLHSNYLLPFFGKMFSKDVDAYKYLSKSAKNFPFGVAFNNILLKNGFINVKHLPQTLGVATIYIGEKQ